MGFSLVAEGLLRAHLPPAQWSPLVARLGYAMGFLIVVLGSQELFTENTVKAVVPFLARRTAESLRHLVRLWTVVLVANLAGALLFAVVVARTEVFSPAARLAFEETARAAMEGGFWLKVLRGVFAGWLIALMVWMLPAAESARVAVVVIVTYLVALGGLTHVVVGSVEAFYLASLGRIGWGAALGGYTLPALIGNTLGGVVLVAALNHAQAAKPA
jgi:formate/nitrite transporter FocA (FNT family)